MQHKTNTQQNNFMVLRGKKSVVRPNESYVKCKYPKELTTLRERNQQQQQQPSLLIPSKLR
jgi:hypothetical protein